MKRFLWLALAMTTSAFAACPCSERADAHAPIGIMKDHFHPKGELMASLRLMSMSMPELINGTGGSSLADYKAANNKMMAPKDMTMQMYMAGLMYGISDKYNLSVMQGYQVNEMASTNTMSGEATTSSTEGLSDTKISLLRNFSPDKSLNLIGSLGLSLPVGSIDESKDGKRLGYPMQLGSGSYGLLYSLTATKFLSPFTVGGQIRGASFLNENSNDYRQGDVLALSAWASYLATDSLSFSLRLERQTFAKISGEDKDMPKMMSTLTNEDYSRRRFDFALLGANWLFKSGPLKGHRLALEYGKLIGHDVEDFQLAPTETVIIGWQKTL